MTTPTRHAESGHPGTMPEADRVVYVAGMGRRVCAKMIDFVAMAMTIVGGTSITQSYLAGLLIGYGWLALSDWFGSPGKWMLRLEVMRLRTAECSVSASAMRNIPIIATALPPKLHQAWLGIDRQQYIQSYTALFVVTTCLGLGMLVFLFVGALQRRDRRHIGDRIAGTIVVARDQCKPTSM